jgi:hypothetical protein
MGSLLTVKRAWWVVGAIAIVLGLFASVGPADWLGKHTIALIALAVILAGILAFAIGRMSTSWGMQPGHLQADKETFTDLTEGVPRRVIDFLKEHDFGNSWSGNHTEPLYVYVAERNAVEHQFHDKTIERKRAASPRLRGVHPHAGRLLGAKRQRALLRDEREGMGAKPSTQ